MSRRRLTDEERAQRKRDRFSDKAYLHYDTSAGFGSPSELAKDAEWMAAQMADGLSFDEAFGEGWGASPPPPGAPPPQRKTTDRDLIALGLEALPADLGELRRAAFTAMKSAHPDYGGNDAAQIDVMAAWTRLKARVPR